MTVKLRTEATAENVRAEGPDVIIVAVGADPIVPDIPGVKKSNVVWVGEADAGTALVGETVVVAGGGATGGETALQLAKDGKSVTVIDMLGYTPLIAGWPRGLLDMLERYNVRLLTEVKLEEVTDTGVLVIDNRWKRFEILADTVILSLGFKERPEVVDEFTGAAPDVYAVGDCVRPQAVMEAVHAGFNVAVEI